MKRIHHIPFVAIISIMTMVMGCKKEKEEPEPSAPDGPTPYDLNLPANLPPMTMPMDNPLTVEGVALGRFLFYEKRLSGNSTMSCATCHGQVFGFTDNGLAVSTGIDGIAGNRNSMPLFNLGWSSTFFWDGRSPTLEKQILEPVPNVIEMHETWPNAVAKVAMDPGYPPLFRAAFGSSVVDSVRVAKAIAQFIRTMVSANSKFDKVLRGEDAFTLDEQLGFDLFNKEGGPPGVPIPMPGGGFIIGQGGGDCFHCHPSAGGLFTDFQFRNNGLDAVFPDPGRGGVTGDPQDMGKFKTPSLRNIAVTGPFMHDGRFTTLDQVLEHYNEGGMASPTVDPFMKFTDPDQTLELTPTKKQQLIAFLNTLTDPTFLNDDRFTDPGPPPPP